MKKNKMKNIIIIILMVSIVLLITSIFLVLTQKPNDENKKEETNKLADTVECTKENEKTEYVTSTQKYILKIDYTGEITGYTRKFINKYTYEDSYNTAKQVETDKNTELKDETFEIIKTEEVTKMLNENGEEVSIWYKDYVKSLESLGYICK